MKSIKIIIPTFICKISILYELYKLENKEINKIDMKLHNTILNNIII